jgi:L-2,4-diaminobutyrate decarboxylase
MPTTSAAADPVLPHDLLLDLDTDASADAGAAFVDLIASYLGRAARGTDPVSTALGPREIADRLRSPLPEQGEPLAAVMRRLAEGVVPESNWLHHPMAMGHQVAPPLPATIWTESLIGALNQSLAVWEMSPVGSVLETTVVRWMCELAGLDDRAGGTFTSGGTEATTTALLAARNARFPNAWTAGLHEPAAIVCGADAHYAVARAAGIIGIGTDNLVTVPSRDHRMDPYALAEALDGLATRGTAVLAVVATAGSTPTGSFDDLDAIAAICEARGIWLHVDAAHGGSALLSEKHRARLRGIHRARSIAWDPHKMMLVPLSAGMLIMRDLRDLDAAFAQRAPYLFNDEATDRLRDHGRRSFMCSRRADVLKLWVALHRYGRVGISALYDHLCMTTRALWEAITAHPELEALHEPECNILCFRYVGDGALDPGALDALNADLRERYNRSGHGWITTTVLNGRRVLRVTIMNPRTTAGHTRSMLARIADLAREPRAVAAAP